MLSITPKIAVTAAIAGLIIVALAWSLNTEDVLAKSEERCDTEVLLTDSYEIKLAQDSQYASEHAVDEVDFHERYTCYTRVKWRARYTQHCQYRNVYDGYGTHVDTVKRCGGRVFVGFTRIETNVCRFIRHSHSEFH